jgi:hypothetical protein
VTACPFLFAGTSMKVGLQSLLYPISVRLPNAWLFNYLLAAVFFVRANGRLPRKADDANAAINDFIFHRMISGQWTQLERMCVDKEHAKALATASANVKVARTVDVFRLSSTTRVDDFSAWLRPHLGKHLVAKPTHGSGTVLFLDRDISKREMDSFLLHSNRNFFHALRETQYVSLERKILLEDNIAKADRINDYKFFCVKGQVLYCQVDVDRFMDHKRAICTIPEFTVIPVSTKFLDIPERVERPRHFDEMLRIASELSRQFTFVRVDLYDTDDGVFFGEFTLTPGAACDNFSNAAFANEFFRRVTALIDSTSIA